MAIYHLSVKIHSRSAGMSAVAGVAYRAGAELADDRTGEVHDYTYTRRSAVDHTEILAPDDAPAWTQDRARLWNQVEAPETRKNSQVAREIVVALPKELAAAEQRQLVRGFVAEQCVDRGMVADVAYHDAGSDNPHAHVLLTTRRIGPDGFADKDRAWNDRAVLQEWRQEWAAAANRALQRAHSPERIDHRSLVDQRQAALDRGDHEAAAALDRPPGTHLGRARHQEIRTGRSTERVTRALERDQVDRPRPSGLERISTFDRELRQAIERTAEALRECVRELRLEVERVGRWMRERAAEAQRQRDQRAERERRRDLVAALRSHEALVKAGRYDAAARLERDTIDRKLPYSDVAQEARDRYAAVCDLRLKRSFDRATPPVTDEDINRAVAERSLERDYGPTR